MLKDSNVKICCGNDELYWKIVYFKILLYVIFETE